MFVLNEPSKWNWHLRWICFPDSLSVFRAFQRAMTQDTYCISHKDQDLIINYHPFATYWTWITPFLLCLVPEVTTSFQETFKLMQHVGFRPLEVIYNMPSSSSSSEGCGFYPWCYDCIQTNPHCYHRRKTALKRCGERWSIFIAPSNHFLLRNVFKLEIPQCLGII